MRHLGRIAFGAEFLPPTVETVEEIRDLGPNNYLAFYKVVPIELVTPVLVHPEMEAHGDFWRRQATTLPAFSSTPPCLRNDFERYVELILAHEGLPPNPESHSGVFRSAFEAHAGPRVEDLVFQNTDLRLMADEASARLSPILAQANAAADEPVDQTHPVRFGCSFNWDTRG